jgi:TolB protein
VCSPQRATLLFLPICAAGARAQPSLCTPQEARWLRDVRQVTSSGMGLFKSGEAYFSPDGRRICFQAVPEGQNEYQIYVMNLDGTGLEMVSTGEGATTCAYFHPDGKRLLFASNHLDPRPVAGVGEAGGPKPGQRSYAWSFYPGMDLFEYSFETMRDGDQEIYICEQDGRNPRRITRARGYDGGPFFSPDGQRLVYRSDRRGDQNLQIFTNNLEGTDERPLTDNQVLNWCPYWHPSGRWIIFTRGEHPRDGPPTYDLYLLSADGSRTLRVTDDRAFDGLPAFSPDGSKLMWTSKRDGLAQAQVFVAEFVGLTRDGELRVAGADATP